MMLKSSHERRKDGDKLCMVLGPYGPKWQDEPLPLPVHHQQPHQADQVQGHEELRLLQAVPMHPLFSYMQSTISPSKAFFISLQCFWSLAFLLVPQISISLLALPISTCILSPLFFRAINFLMIVVLISQPDNSNILAIYESGSDAWSFSIPAIFFAF